MIISEQVEVLRIAVETCKQLGREGIAKFMSEAADTIEALSTKLQAANMEQTVADCGGGWIPCKERLPKEDNDVLIYTRYGGVDMAYISDGNWKYTRGDEFINTIEDANILAWQPLPEPYHEH